MVIKFIPQRRSPLKFQTGERMHNSCNKSKYNFYNCNPFILFFFPAVGFLIN